MSEFNGFNDDPHAGPPSQIQTSDFEDYDGDEIHQGFYGSNPYLKFPDGKLVHDRAANNHLIETIQKVVFESEEGLFIVSDKKGKTIDLNVFISKNATYLWQSYRKTRPKKWEIVIFLEDNDRDLFSSRAFAVKMGAKARAVLLDNAKSRRKNVYGGIQSDANAEKTVPDFDKREIQELLLTGQIASEESNFYMPVLQAIGYLNGLFAKLYLKLGRGIMSACATVKDNIKLQEKHWNPEAKENQGQDFVPFLLPIQHFGLDLLEVGVKAFTKAILDYQDSITGYLDEFLAFDLPILPPGLKLFQLVLQKFRDRIKAALDGIGKAMVNGAAWLMQFFIDLGHGAVNMINAFLCGLYNSIVDTVVGFFEIIGLLCQGVGGAAKAISRPQRTLAAALELMDEMMQLLLDFNPFEFVESIFNGLQRGVQKASEFFGSLNIEKVSYFLGACVGMLLENLIGAVFSFGALNLARFASKNLGALGKYIDVMVKVTQDIKGQIDKLEASVFEKLIEALFWLFPLLRKGKEGIEALFDQFFSKVNQALIVPDELILQYAAKVQMSNKQVKQMKAAGWKYIDVDIEQTKAVLKIPCS